MDVEKSAYFPSKAVLLGCTVQLYLLFNANLGFWGRFLAFEMVWLLLLVDWLLWASKKRGVEHAKG